VARGSSLALLAAAAMLNGAAAPYPPRLLHSSCRWKTEGSPEPAPQRAEGVRPWPILG